MAEHETIADVIAAMRDEGRTCENSCLEWVGAKMRHYADRFEAAHRRERGNAAKLREALRSCLDTICRIVWIDDPEYDEDGHYLGANYAAVSRDKARAALDAPPRNCDVGTADDWLAQFNVVCERCSGSDCDHRLFKDEEVCDCFARWLQMPYEEGGAK